VGDILERLPAKVYTYVMHQDDPKKCTSAKMCRMRLATPIYRLHHIHPKMVVLDPTSTKIFTPKEDVSCGILIIDCSWQKVGEVFMQKIRGRRVRLPLLIAANPVHYGHIGVLSSLEAAAAALYLISEREQAENMLKIYKWGPNFLLLNKHLLDAYLEAGSEEDILEVEKKIFRVGRERVKADLVEAPKR